MRVCLHNPALHPTDPLDVMSSWALVY